MKPVFDLSPSIFEWITIGASSLTMCVLAFLILGFLHRYSNFVRHGVIATLMVGHLVFLLGFAFLPKLPLDVIPVGWSAVAKLDLDPQQNSFSPTYRNSIEAKSADFENEIAQQSAREHASDMLNFENVEIAGQRDLFAESIDPVPPQNRVDAEPSNLNAAAFSLSQLLSLVWMIGFTAIAAWFTFANVWARRQVACLSQLKFSQQEELLSETCQLLSVKRPPVLKSWNDNRIPMLLGLFWPVVVVPDSFATWSRPRQRHVLMHELSHLKRRDGLHDAITWLAVSCFWFNPLIWLLKKRQGLERELACDHAVVAYSENAEQYAADLLSVVKDASGFAPSASVAMARTSELRRRIESILRFDPSALRRGVGIPRFFCGSILTAALTGSTFVISQVALQEDDVLSQPTVELIESTDDFASELEPDLKETCLSIRKKQIAIRGEPITTEISASGRVVDQNGKPVAGATVYLRENESLARQTAAGQNIKLMKAFVCKTRQLSFAKTKTNADGEFKFENIQTPKYFEPLPSRSTLPQWAVVVIPNDESQAMNWKWLERPKNQEPIEITLPAADTFSGVVVDRNGVPVSNANVSVLWISRGGELSKEEQVAQTQRQRERRTRNYLGFGNSILTRKTGTDENGRFMFEDLPRGHYVRLRLEHTNLIALQSDLLAVSGSLTQPHSLTMDEGWRLKFSARSPSGEPVPEAGFQLSGSWARGIPDWDTPFFDFTTDINGEFVSPPLPVARATIWPRLVDAAASKLGQQPKWIARSLKVEAGRPGEQVDAEMNFELGKLIHGQIVPIDTSQPITAEEFQGLLVHYTVITDDTLRDTENYSSRPDSKGRFEIRVRDGVEGQIAVGKDDEAFGFDLPGSVEMYLFGMRISQRRKEASQGRRFPAALNREKDPLDDMPSRKIIQPNEAYTADAPIVLPVARSKSVRGILVDETGNPVVGAKLKMLNRRKINYGGDLQASFPADPITDKNGRFVLRGIQQRFLPFIQAIHPTKELTSDFGWPSFEVEDGEEVRLTMKPGPTIRVLVKLGGKPLANQPVSLTTSFENRFGGSRASRQLKTDSQGICVFNNLARCKDNFVSIERSEKDRYWKTISTLGDQMEFIIDDVSFISEGNGIVSGKLVDPNGKPVANARVRIAEYKTDLRFSGKHYETVTSDSSGAFVATKVPDDKSLLIKVTPEFPAEARFPRSPMNTALKAKSGDRDLRIIVDPRLSQELPWRARRDSK